ncbi:MAG TPA: glycosyltransferase N-terminal domain-containing protein [Gemmatimonadaceae bacterium]|nr:glycosyltransferase N-terminal domain-containing protein [Gemmatimonadaceae bacterium]
MHPVVRFSYETAGAITRLGVSIAPPGKTKLLRALSARRGLLDRYRDWAHRNRDSSRPLLWVHAPSVGEGLQALPVIERFRARRPDAQLIYTFYSPSAERFAASTGADFFDYLPFDDVVATAEALDLIVPTALVFSKLDVWPLLVENAVKRGVKLGLLSATVPESSGRRSGVALLALREAYSALDVVGAISPSDAERLLAMGVRGEKMTVTGDTRYDQVWARATTPSESRDRVVARYADSRKTLVAGSTWPPDEKRLLPAWLHTRRQLPTVRLIIAPHELSKRHLTAIERWARDSSLTLSRTSEAEPRATDVVLVDDYGILADMYAVGDAAYVGGGFHSDGLHSMLEPAAFGAPVLVGPMHSDNRDAGLLVNGGGAVRCPGPGDISARLLAWFRNPQVLSRASASARRVVEAGIGAAERSTELVESLFEDPARKLEV